MHRNGSSLDLGTFLQSMQMQGVSDLLPAAANVQVYESSALESLLDPTRVRIAIVGSLAKDHILDESQQGYLNRKIDELAEALHESSQNITLVTGACANNTIPHEVAMELNELPDAPPILGVSPKIVPPRRAYWSELTHASDAILYTGVAGTSIPRGHQFSVRDLVFLMSVDAVISLYGASGTNQELGLAYMYGLPVGLVKGTGGATDAQQAVVEALSYFSTSKFTVSTSEDCRFLVTTVIEQARHTRGYKKRVISGPEPLVPAERVS